MLVSSSVPSRLRVARPRIAAVLVAAARIRSKTKGKVSELSLLTFNFALYLLPFLYICQLLTKFCQMIYAVGAIEATGLRKLSDIQMARMVFF